VEAKKITEVGRLHRDYRACGDEELALLVSEGDKIALETLYDRYSRQAIRLAQRIVGQAELAEEIAQESFLRFWERPDLFQAGRGRFISWLLSVVHHRAINERRRSAFRLNVSVDQTFSTSISKDNPGEEATLLHHLSAEGVEPHELVWAQVQREAVRLALSQLTHSQRRVIELAYFKGLNQREIAQELDEPLGTVKSRTRSAMQKLKIILDAQGLVGSELTPEQKLA
jgi:RNA polymerase sigma-70 factor (ECF subfamily)